MTNRPSKHFTWSELSRSSTARRNKIDNTAPESVRNNLILVANVLEGVREKYGRPLTPNSVYRCLDLNRFLGSSDRSKHVQGRACDIEVPGVPNRELAQWIRESRIPNISKVLLEFSSPTDPSAGWVHFEIREGHDGHIRCFEIQDDEVIDYNDRSFLS